LISPLKSDPKTNAQSTRLAPLLLLRVCFGFRDSLRQRPKPLACDGFPHPSGCGARSRQRTTQFSKNKSAGTANRSAPPKGRARGAEPRALPHSRRDAAAGAFASGGRQLEPAAPRGAGHAFRCVRQTANSITDPGGVSTPIGRSSRAFRPCCGER
jgi:hypothetical protein